MRETGLKQVFYLNTEYILFVQSVLEMKFIKGRKNTGRNTIKMGKKIEYNTNDKQIQEHSMKPTQGIPSSDKLQFIV